MKKGIIICSAILLLTFNSVFGACIVCLNFGNGWRCALLEGDCSLAGGSGLSDFGGYGNGRYCQGALVVANRPPIIRIDMKGRAFLDNNGQITQIASDKTQRFYANVDKITKTDIATFLKNDDGIVSQKRLETIAKEVGAKIEKSDKSITANYCPACELTKR